MREETFRILKMIEDGKITAEKAKELIDAIENQERKDLTLSDSYKKRILKISVDDKNGDMIRINLPVSIINLIIKTTGSLPDLKGKLGEGVNLDEIIPLVCAAFESEIQGDIVSIESPNGDTVKILVE